MESVIGEDNGVDEEGRYGCEDNVGSVKVSSSGVGGIESSENKGCCRECELWMSVWTAGGGDLLYTHRPYANTRLALTSYFVLVRKNFAIAWHFQCILLRETRRLSILLFIALGCR